MHTWYYQEAQLFQDYGYPIFLAEVASTFNEELLTHYLLQRADDDRLRAFLIDRQIEDLGQCYSGRRCLPSLKNKFMRSKKRAVP